MITILGIIGWIALIGLGIIFWPSYIIYWILTYEFVDVSFAPIEIFGGVVVILVLVIVQLFWLSVVGWLD